MGLLGISAWLAKGGEVTINPPPIGWSTATKPWTLHMPYKLDPSYKIYEYAERGS